MIDPVSALGAFAVLVAFLLVVFWPGRGLAARFGRMARHSARVHLEDAVKYLYMSRRTGREASLEGLAGKLQISRGRAADVLSGLVESGLARADEGELRLTERGRALAVRTVRTHRLWESWLADRTGVEADEWHDQAERMEHTLSDEEIETISARLGHPRYDPHGDPIPTAEGELPDPVGTPLSRVETGRAARVLHLEDEPRSLYRRLVEFGLAPGVRVQLLERSPRGLRLRTDLDEGWLDPFAAGNVTVELLPEDVELGPPGRSLDEVPPGERVRVLGIAPVCRGPQRRRLLDLGLVRGALVEPEYRSASGDPVAYRVRGALIALRRDQARWIQIGPVEDGEEAAPATSPPGAAVGGG